MAQLSHQQCWLRNFNCSRFLCSGFTDCVIDSLLINLTYLPPADSVLVWARLPALWPMAINTNVEEWGGAGAINSGERAWLLQSPSVESNHDLATDERRSRGVSSLGAVFIVVNAALGAGLLNFPAAFNMAGGVTAGVMLQMVRRAQWTTQHFCSPCVHCIDSVISQETMSMVPSFWLKCFSKLLLFRYLK